MASQDLCSLTDVRSEAEIPASDTSRDTLIGGLITAASDAIMKEVDREFAPASTGVTRRFRVDNYGLNLAPYDLRSVTTMTLHPESTSPQTLTANTDYELTPVNSSSGTFQSVRFSSYRSDLLVSDHTYRFGFAQVDITGNWGFASVPTVVNRAAVLTVLAWIRRDVAALGLSNDFDVSQPQSPTTFGIPYEARRLLASYYRQRMFAF